MTYARAGGHDVGLLLGAVEYSAVQKFLGENFGELWDREVLGVLPVKYGNRERVNEHLRVDAVAAVGSQRQQVLDSSHALLE